MVQITDWEFSDEEGVAQVPEEGLRYLMVLNVDYNKDDATYNVRFQDLQNEVKFWCNYWLNNVNEDNTITPNRNARGTLVTLGHSILGTSKGIPYPDDIVGGITCGEVSLKTSAKGNPYPRIFEYKPVSSDWAALGTLDGQYYEDE